MVQGCKRILVQAPTGSGKTALCTNMIASCEAKQFRSWFIVHRRELINQSLKAYDKGGLSPSVISAGFPMDDRYLSQICSINTLIRRLDKAKPPKLIVHDEAHHVPAKSWQKIIHEYPDAFHVGLTATPCRLDGKGLNDFFDEMVLGPKVNWLIEEGWLSPYKYYAPSNINLTGVRTRMGDFAKGEIESVVNDNAIIGDAVANYIKYCNGKRCIVFCVTIAHSKHVAQSYCDANIPAWHVDGETPQAERDWAIKEFKAGRIKVLCNVDLFGEGFDVPAIEAVQLLRPTQSLGLFLQQVGRSLRPVEDKTRAIILDHVGNWERHGLPDEDREWSLEGAPVKSKNEISTKQCPKCYNVQPVGRKSCQACGFTFPKQAGGGREIVEAEGELNEVTPEMAKFIRKREQGAARTLEDLIQLGIKRGYKSPERWAYAIHQYRMKKKNYGKA